MCFFGSLFVLVNGCPIVEISIKKGLKQGNPLAPFLFLFVVEGLSGLMRRAVGRRLFTRVAIGDQGLSISHLQYADDTLLIGEASVDNLFGDF